MKGEKRVNHQRSQFVFPLLEQSNEFAKEMKENIDLRDYISSEQKILFQTLHTELIKTGIETYRCG